VNESLNPNTQWLGDAVQVSAGRARLRSKFNFVDQMWSALGPLQYSARPIPSIVVYARADGGFAVWDPARNHHWLRRGGDVANPNGVRRSQFYSFSAESLWNGLEVHGKTLCNGLIRDWVSWQRQPDPTNEGESPFSLLRSTLAALSPHSNDEHERIRPGQPVRLFIDDSREFPTIDFGYGSIPVIHASAGMQRILGLAYLLVWAWREHIEASKLLRKEPVSQILFLMDEVETHLHPQWQRRLVPSILKVFEGLRSSMQAQLFLTTHAPLVLASLEPLFNPQIDKSFVFDLKNGSVQLNELPWFKRGDAVDWLTSDAFQLEQARSIEAEMAIEDAERFMRGEEPKLHKTRDEIDRELHRVLGGDDIFWPRWIVRRDGTQP
jgi:hypothetical protein